MGTETYRSGNSPETAPWRPLRTISHTQRFTFPFWGLVFFTFVLFVGPQFIFPSLQPLRLAAVSAALTLAVYLFDRLVGRQPLSVGGPVVRLMVSFLALAALSIPFSLWPGGSMDALTDILGKSMLVFLLVANTIDTARGMKVIMWSLVLWSIPMSLRGIQDFSTGNLALDGLRIAGYDAPLSANPNDLAVCLNLILALAIGLFQGTKNALSRLVLLASIGLAVAGVVVTFSRGGLVTLVAIGLVFAWRHLREHGPLFLVPVLVTSILGVAMLPIGYGQRMLTIFVTTADTTGSASARWDGMVLAFKLMLTHPIVGLGLNVHGLAFVDSLGWTGVHNAFLQAGADLGVAGFVVSILLVWRVWRTVRDAERQLKAVPGTTTLRALGFGVELATVAYCVAACFAPIAYNFYLYYVAGFAVAFHTMARLAFDEAAIAHGEVRGVAQRPSAFQSTPRLPPTPVRVR